MDNILNDIKKYKHEKINEITFTEHELNLIRIAIYNFLASVKYKDIHKEGNDISDYVREMLGEIKDIGNRIDKEIRG